MNITEVYSKPIYNRFGNYVGELNDLVLEISPGLIKIIGLTTKELEYEKKMILFSSVQAIGDIIILK